MASKIALRNARTTWQYLKDGYVRHLPAAWQALSDVMEHFGCQDVDDFRLENYLLGGEGSRTILLTVCRHAGAGDIGIEMACALVAGLCDRGASWHQDFEPLDPLESFMVFHAACDNTRPDCTPFLETALAHGYDFSMFSTRHGGLDALAEMLSEQCLEDIIPWFRTNIEHQQLQASSAPCAQKSQQHRL